jgi:hypothetical protein
MTDKRFPSRAIGYMRTSTRRQDTGLEQQLAAIRSFAKQFRIDVPMIFADEGVTGMSSKKAIERLDLRGALSMARDFKCPLIMKDLTRLTRTPSVVRTLWREFSVDIICVDDAAILTPRMVLDRVRKGHRQGVRIQKGTRAAVRGRPPAPLSEAAEERRRRGGVRGSKNNAAKADDLVRAICLVLEKEDPEGRLTMREAAQLLNDRGITTRGGKEWDEVKVRRHLNSARAQIEFERELSQDAGD